MDGTGTLFESFISALGEEFSVQVVRYPTVGTLGYKELEDHARRSLPSSGKFVILGESFSGPIAVSIAASRPVGLVGLIHCATFIRNPRPLFGPLRHFASAMPIKLAPLWILSSALLGSFSNQRLRSVLAEAMSQVSSETLRSRLRAVLSVDVSAKLKAIDVPLLYLLAQHDQVVPVSAFEQIKQVLPAIQVAPINAPHFLLQTAPNEAASAVGKFMRSLHNAL